MSALTIFRANTIFRGKNIALNTCIRKQERLGTNELSIYFKKFWGKAIELTHTHTHKK